MGWSLVEIFASILSAVLSSGVVLYLVQRYFSRRDKAEESERKIREDVYRKIDASLETIRLLSYYRLSEEIERLLTKGYATPSDRRVLKEMYSNYKTHGWNGDMDSRLERVYNMRTSPKDGKAPAE